MIKIIIKDFKSYQETISEVLKESRLAEKIKNQRKILLKPNLTTTLPPPVTTPVELVKQVIEFCKENSRAKIIIAEGSGGCDTNEAFEKLGYFDLGQKYQVEVLDLNRALRKEKRNEKALRLKKIFLPKIAFESYIINLPVLKVHSVAKMTAAMKNVFGFYLNQSYLSRAGEFLLEKVFKKGWWNKSELHFIGVNEAIIDLNGYLKFNFNLVDASVGLLEEEVHGILCFPPIKKIIADYDSKEVDKVCASLLGLNVEQIKYLK